jgi:transposase-like protein
MERRFLEKCLAKGMSLEAIGKEVGKHPSTVGYWMKKHGVAARGAEKYAPRGALNKDELKALAEHGATVVEMAETLDRSPSTIRYWLRQYEIEIRTRRGPRRRVATGHGSQYSNAPDTA